jgi:hypothetical protein
LNDKAGDIMNKMKEMFPTAGKGMAVGGSGG